MFRQRIRRDRHVALFIAALMLFNPPILNLVGGTLFGWPALYLYLFAVWAVLIVATALIVERGGNPPGRHDRDVDRP